MDIGDMGRGRPIFCRFEDPDDAHGGVVIDEPTEEPDPYDPAKDMWVIRLDNNGLTYELRARNQMIDAIISAVSKAGVRDLSPGGYLGVTFTGYRGKLKLYSASYEPPEDRGGCADPRGLDPIGVGAPESDPDDPGHDQAAF